MHQSDVDLQGRPQLNFDVLRLVCDSLTAIPDVLSFARTCSALTGTAFRRRLRMSPINLWHKRSLDSFERFIFADQAARAPHIYGLRLHITSGDPQLRTSNARLVAILQAAVHLQYIHLSTDVHLDPVLTAAANMTSLRELHIFSAPDSPWKHLSAFRSPLRILRIHEFGLNGEGVTAMLLQNHLANFAPTLEVLDLATGYFDIGTPRSLVTTQFTATRSLTIGNLNFNQFTMEVLLRLFPGLDSLVLFGVHPMSDTESAYPYWREVNKEVQNTLAWPGLHHVSCNADCAFVMALRCLIRSMDIVVAQPQVKRYLAPALRHNYPQRLHLHVIDLNDGLGDLDELLPSEGAENLTHLIVFFKFRIGHGLEYGRNDREVPWFHFRDKLIVSIRRLRRLTHLRLVFHYDLRQGDPWRDFMYTADEKDLHPAMRKLAGTTPTLRYIFLTTCGETKDIARRTVSQTVNKWLSSKAWWVDVVRDHDEEDHPEPSNAPNADAEVSCTELSRSAAERIIDQEELHLHHYEEQTLRACGDSDSDSAEAT